MMHRYTILAVTVLLCGGCVTVDMTVKENGGADVVISYPAGATTTEAQVKGVLTAPGITVTKVEITPAKATAPKLPKKGAKAAAPPSGKMVTATLTATKLEDLEQVPYLKVFGLDITTGGGGSEASTLKAVLKNHKPGRASALDSTNTIRVKLPGTVSKTSAKLEGGQVVWSFPTADYFKQAALDVSISYKVAEAGDGSDSDS